MPFREPLVCLAEHKLCWCFLKAPHSSWVFQPAIKRQNLVRAGLMRCLDANSHFIPLRAWVDRPREARREEEEASEAMLWLQGG